MPTPDRTSLEAIVLAASNLLEEEGLAGLTMHAVAHRVGVRGPSLYKRVVSRDQLIQLVAEAALVELADRLHRATTADQLVDTFRVFGHERPAAFQLVMAPGARSPVARDKFGAAAAEDILRIAHELAGDEHALDAARMLVAWAAGFITMELNDGFRLGGDVEQAWKFGVAAIVAAITVAHPIRE